MSNIATMCFELWRGPLYVLDNVATAVAGEVLCKLHCLCQYLQKLYFYLQKHIHNVGPKDILCQKKLMNLVIYIFSCLY